MHEQLPFIRQSFPALARQYHGQPLVYLDGPAGSQVPASVARMVADHLLHHNANHGGSFITSRENDAMLAQAQQACADLIGCDDPETIIFGANMTTLTLAFSRALARTWQPGDAVVVTQLDHDANYTPWVLAARDAGAEVRVCPVDPRDCTLDLDALARLLTPRTRLVAVTAASNAVGTLTPLPQIAQLAHAVGAQVFVDAVHLAPHRLIDVQAFGCDYLVASAYKFFGPHVGVLWGRRELLESLRPYKVRPAPEQLPDRWMTGTQNFACIAGTLAAIDYLAELGRRLAPAAATRRAALVAAFAAISDYERWLGAELLAGLGQLPDVRVLGITDPARFDQRVPTVSFTHARLAPREVARRLAAAGINVWSGNYYALPLTESLGLEPAGMVRVGLLHYNTPDEVHRLLDTLARIETLQSSVTV
jgi:cysteine desulfurase family protein (TIGR01976 family)